MLPRTSRSIAALLIAGFPFFSAGCNLINLLFALLGIPLNPSNAPTRIDDDCPSNLTCRTPACLFVGQNGSFERGFKIIGFPDLFAPAIWRSGTGRLEANEIHCRGFYGLRLHYSVNGDIKQAYQLINLNDVLPVRGSEETHRLRVGASFSFHLSTFPSPVRNPQLTFKLTIFTFSGLAFASFPEEGDPYDYAGQATAMQTTSVSITQENRWTPIQTALDIPSEIDVLLVLLEYELSEQPEEWNVYVDGVDMIIDKGPYPPLANEDHASTRAGEPVRLDVLANDYDLDGEIDTTSVAVVVAPPNGTAEVNDDGSITYTSDNSFTGTDHFSYTISDRDGFTAGALVTIEVIENRPPQAQQDVYAVPPNDTLTVPASSGVLANDDDPDGDALTALLESVPQHGTLTLQTDGGFTYTADAGFPGLDWFTYRASDGRKTSDVTVAYLQGNRPPMAYNDVFHALPDANTTLDVLFNDVDPDGDSILIDFIGTPVNGSALLTSDNRISYRPAAGFTGEDVFGYLAVDEHGARSNEAEVRVLVSDGPAYDLAVDLRVNPDTVFFGGQTTFTATVHNNGPADAAGVVVTLPFPQALPPPFAITETQTTQGTYTTGTWDVGPLGAGQSATLTITGEARDAPTITRQARIVGGLGPGDDPTNNTALVTLVVRTD